MKIFTKIIGVFLGLSMAAGVGFGVAAGNTKVARAEATSADITDIITASDLSATNTTYKDFSGVTKTSGAVYAGNSAKDSSGNIQMRSKNSNSGIVSTASGGYLKSVTITVGNGSNTIDVYGNTTAYADASDLYAIGSGNNQGTKVGSVSATGTITIPGNYTYVGIRSNNGAIYITSIEITWSSSGDTPVDPPEPETVLTVSDARTKALNSDTGTYSVQGIVTEFDYGSNGSIKGFYMNDTNGIGIDVFTGTSLDLGVSTGQLVTISGALAMYKSMPEITSPTLVASEDTTDTVTPITISNASDIGNNVGNLLIVTATYTSDGSSSSTINDTFTVGDSTFMLYSSYASSTAATNYTTAKEKWTAGSTEVNLVGIGQTFTSSGSTVYEIILTDLTVNTIISGDFAQDFLNSITCNSLGTTAPTFTGNPYSSWSEIASAYSALTSTQQGVLTSTIANESGTTAQQAVAKYDYIVGKYGYDDFMHRNPAPIANARIPNLINANQNAAPIIIVLALIGITSIFVFIYAKKKKEE